MLNGILKTLSLAGHNHLTQCPNGQRQRLHPGQHLARFTAPLDLTIGGIQLPIGQACQLAGIVLLLLHPTQDRFSLGIPQRVADTLQQQRQVDRLGNEIGGTGFKRMVDRVDIIRAGQHDNGGSIGCFQCSDASAGVKTVHLRHVHIHEHQLWPVLLKGIHTFAPVNSLNNTVTRLGKPGLEQHPNRSRVLDNQYHRGLFSHASLRFIACSHWPLRA